MSKKIREIAICLGCGKEHYIDKRVKRDMTEEEKKRWTAIYGCPNCKHESYEEKEIVL